MGLDALFSPQAVAVIGASNRELTIGYRIIENLLDFGYRGKVYPVNPKGGEIRGLQAYPSILDVPEGVDVAHIVIKNKYVPACVEDCARKGIKAVIVNTAGFREIGDEGAALEDQLVAVANKTGIRVFGPNCQGIINTDEAARAYCNFTFTRPTCGHISIVAQSGGVGEVIHQRIVELGVGVRLYASNGNACDVSIPEIIRHFGQDEQTRVIVVHIESLPDPRAFLEAATDVARHKPILGMKVGRTEEGAKAVSSHTGGMIKQDTAAELAALLAKRIKPNSLLTNIFLNVNLPNLPLAQIKGLQTTHLASGSHTDEVEEGHDGKQRYYWLIRQKRNKATNNKTDVWAIEQGNISITPLPANLLNNSSSHIPDSLCSELLQELQKR